MTVELDRVTFSYGPRGARPAVSDLSLVAADGRVSALVGATGSGKSTVLRMAAGLVRPDSGRVLVDGRPTWEARGPWRRARRAPGLPRAVGYVMQRPERQLFCDTVADDVAFGPKNLGAGEAEAAAAAEAALDLLGVADLAGRSPFELSGGQQRLVAIAGVLAMEPRNLVLDEPMSALDPSGRDVVRDAVGRLAERRGAVVLVTHEMDDVALLASEVFVLDRGRLAMEGTPDEVFSRAGELHDLGLGVPAPTAFASRLAGLGMDVGLPLTLDGLADSIASVARRGRGEGEPWR